MYRGWLDIRIVFSGKWQMANGWLVGGLMPRNKNLVLLAVAGMGVGLQLGIHKRICLLAGFALEFEVLACTCFAGVLGHALLAQS